MDKQVFQPRKIDLDSEYRRGIALAVIPNLPIDADLEVVIQKKAKPRKPSQNALMWVGPLADISDQAWVEGNQYSPEVWHEHFKRAYLPEDDDPEIRLLAKAGYRKWDYLPNGDRVLIGSTTDLLVKGMAVYITQVEAFGASLGVMFHANPRDRWAA